MQYRPVEGDPQTRLQDDKDPMLIVRGRAAQGRAMESELDPDPEGDLGMLTANQGVRQSSSVLERTQAWRTLTSRDPAS